MNRLLGYLTKVYKMLSWKFNDLLFFIRVKKSPVLTAGKTALLYHGVAIEDNRTFNTKFISKTRLFKQLSWLKKHAHLVSTEDYARGSSNQEKHQICLTFDDGFENNYTLLFPILKQLHIPATIFITPIQQHGYDILWPDLLDLASPSMPASFLFHQIRFTKKRGEFYHPNGMRLKKWLSQQARAIKKAFYEVMKPYQTFKNQPTLDCYWKLLSSDQIREMAQHPLITIGAHGSWHNNLNEIPLLDTIQELQVSKTYLENITQTPVISLAYPDGSYSKELKDAAQNIGYQHQFAMDYVSEEDELDKRIMNRLGINPFISWNNQITAIGKGKY